MRRGYSELGAAAIAIAITIAIMTALLYFALCFVINPMLKAFGSQAVVCELKSDALKVTQ